MTSFPRRFLLLAFGAAAAIALSLAVGPASDLAWSQAARTIKLVVPFPPGGGIDVLTRVMGDEVARARGVAVVVENRPGAGTLIGTEAVLRAAPDGATLLVNNNSSLITPHLRKVDYDPLADLLPICKVATTPTVIVVTSDSPYRTLDDLVRAARGKPGELTYGSVSAGVLNVGFEMFSRLANFSMTFVPFGGTPPAINALLGGHITAGMVDYPSAAGQLQAGKLRALATGSRTRISALANVPTIAELGYKDYELEVWYGVFAPAKTPASLISQFSDWFSQAVQTTEVKSRLAAQQITPAALCGTGFAADLRKQYEENGRAIRDANIKAE